MASSSSSSSSSSVHHRHDVFLSFRGEDTRNNFTSHLYAALQRKGIEAFIDNELERGEGISSALLKAIQESKISVVIISEHYASSPWCLEEACKIVECKNTYQQIVVPIFYHVNPSDVRKQKGSFAAAFAKHEEDFKEVQRWRDALKEICNLTGYHFPKDRSECELIEQIVKDISMKLIYKSPNDSEALVGLNSHIEQIESLLHINEVDVRIVGIWGMGGIGKTTLAEAVFNQNFAEFEVYCFLANVREELEKHGQIHLWEKLLSTILEERNLCIGTCHLPNFVRDRLFRKKALIVLDDMNDSLQFDLFRDKHCFGPGSRIIITSRDKQVLRQVVDENDIYEVKQLNDVEALQLFSLNAFKQRHPMEDWMELSMKVIDYAKGVPLALKVLGSALYSKSKREWESELNKLKQIANPKIHNLLRISYDGLDTEMKDMFLDIACFFRGEDRDYVTEILGGCFYSVHSGISVLIDKSLITISENKLGIHDLIQEMGWNIVREESIKEPGKRSRLWNPKDVYHVLKNNSGTEAVEGIFLDMSKIRELRLTRPTFAKMYNLRLLKLYCSDYYKRDPKLYLSQEALEGLSDKLCYLHWDGYPLKSLPLNFCPENLVELDMSHSHVKQLWDGAQKLVNLKSLNLSYSQHLVKIPDLSHATNLESMTLVGCKSLVEVPLSIGYLNKLGWLNLSDCSSITKFPKVPRELQFLCLDGSAIEEVPPSVGCLSGLKYLHLVNCKHLERIASSFCKLNSLHMILLSGCSKLKSFPEILEPMEGLKELHLDGSGIEELPSSIDYLINLRNLSLTSCKNLPSHLKNLKSLYSLELNDCNLLEFPSWLTCMSLLRYLDLSGNSFESIPPSIKQLSVLKLLYLNNCKRLRSIPELPSSLRYLEADNCTALETVSLTEFIKDWVFDFDNTITEWAFDFDKTMKVWFLNYDKTHAGFVFPNCLKLDKLAMGCFAKEAQLRSQQIANVHVEKYRETFEHYCHGVYQEPSLTICFPGSEIPEWFACRSMGSTISTRLDLRYDCSFTLAVVVAFEENNNFLPISCCFQFKTDSLPILFRCILYHGIDGNAVDYCKVKKCGVHLWYVGTETGSGSSDLLDAQDRECNSNHDPNQLSLKCDVINQAFGEPIEEDGTVSKRSCDDDCYNEATPSKFPSSNEEEEEPFPKRLKYYQFF